MKKQLLTLLLSGCLAFGAASTAYAAAAEYHSGSLAGHTTKYVTVDMSTTQARVMLANGSINSAQSIGGMATANNAIAAINGTYFSAYDGNPIPWGTVMQDSRLLHTGGGAIMGITSDGKLLIDRITFSLKGYVNGSSYFLPWRINHYSDISDAITIFTSEYSGTITPPSGSKTVLVGSDNQVTSITTSSFTTPAGGFAVVYNPQVANRVDLLFHIGDTVTYEATVNTTFTQQSDWDNVQQALGAGPSLIINGTVTADGTAEGFTEAKINTNRAGRSFIGATADGDIIIGNIASATLKEAAAVCQQLSLVNAMCLDGGGSIALYYDGVKSSGRNINNALGFFERPIAVNLDGSVLTFDVNPTVRNSTTLVPLRAIFEALNANVSWNSQNKDLTATLNGTDTSIYLRQDSTQMRITTAGQTREVTLLAPATAANGRILVPLRAISEAFGCNVAWDGTNRTVNITTAE